MVVGSDRIREFDTLLKKYNSVKGRHGFYKFNNIEIVSAGERDADADDVSGMSASKMRAFADKGDLDSFKQGVHLEMLERQNNYIKMFVKVWVLQRALYQNT